VFDQERSETDKISEDPMKRAQHLREVCDQLDKLGQVPIELERHSYQYMYVNDEYIILFNATFNNISVKSRRSVLMVEETRVLGENHRPVTDKHQTL
jgi:translation elongation factor P/translation initiation factor 5A